MNLSTQFQKGMIPWNKGVLGSIKVNSGSFKKGQIAHNKGKKCPTGEIHAKNIVGQKFNRWTVIERTPFKNKHNYWLWLCQCECGVMRAVTTQLLKSGGSKSCGCLRADVMKAKSGTHCHTIESKKKLSDSHKGALNPQWRGGISTETQKERNKVELKLWKRACLERDNFTCQKTGIRGGKLAVHHIKNFSSFPKLRTAINNGITLGFEVHKEFHRRYGIRNNTVQQIEEFIGRKL